MPNTPLPEWDALLSSVAHLRVILPDAVLVGGTAAVLAQLESVAGWKTARVRRPVLILGSLDGIETGIRQLIRDEPLETEEVEVAGEKLLLPSKAEMLRIKAVLILRRNATRDYLDTVAMSVVLGPSETLAALKDFDRLYPQTNGESPIQQLQIQLANPLPYDLDDTDLSQYKHLREEYREWQSVKDRCAALSEMIFRAGL